MSKQLMMMVSVCLSVFILVGCGGQSDEAITVYSGRSKPLVDGIVSEFEQQHDVTVNVKYARDAQLLAALKEEGEQSPADVFWANTTGALSNAVDNDLLSELPDSIMQQPRRFQPTHNQWVPVTTRFRVLAYNSDAVQESDLPGSVLDLPDNEQLSGRIGWTPTYSSFQDFVTALWQLEGKQAANDWLQQMKSLNPNSYASNTPMVKALANGEIDVALTNHYYVLRMKYGGAEGEYEGHEDEDEEESEEEESQPDPDVPVQTHYFSDGDPGNLAMVTGAGMLSTSERQDNAQKFIRFLMSEKAQKMAATSVNEYPVIAGTEVPDYMLPVDQALSNSPDYSFDRLGEIDQTLELLRRQGVL